MSSCDIGNAAPLTLSPADSESNPVDVAGLALSITEPDGTALGPFTPTHGATGEYSYAFTPTQAGRHLIRWAGTGYAQADVLNVWPTDPGYLFGIAEARAALRTDGTYQADDGTLRLFMAAVTPVIEDIVGPVASAAGRVFVTDGGGSSILLPVIGAGVVVTGVVVNGQTLDPATDYTLDAANGILYAGPSSSGDYYGELGAGFGTEYGRRFQAGRQNVTITYSLAPTVRPNVLLAAIEEFRFLYQVGRQGSRPTMGNDGTITYTPAGYAVPRRVLELCAGSAKLPGFA